MSIQIKAQLQMLVEMFGFHAVCQAMAEVIAENAPDVFKDYIERREALATAANKFGLLPHRADAVKTEGRNN